MRLGVVFTPAPNAYYRAVEPMMAMERRGHEIVWPDQQGRADPSRIMECDVVHVYRRSDVETRQALKRFTSDGRAFTYDNDDDYTAIPKEAAGYKHWGGFKGQRVFAESAQMARSAAVVSTTTEVLAEKYRRAGVEQVQVIANHLAPGSFRKPRDHAGIVIGWVAGGEHRYDAARIAIANALQRLIEKHDSVRVHMIGIELPGLPSERYERENLVEFPELPDRICGWDIGIAPLADSAFNRARSDVKLKEYAACGVPWLASPVGPYAGLGEDQGGLLVPDDGWYEAIERLVTRGRERQRLARRAQRWAEGEKIDVVADHWERLFSLAAAR